MYDPASGDREERRIGPAEVFDYFGVGPDKVVDVQALAGDSTDNVPGAPGIGVKTAAQLIGEYGDLETLLARAGEIKQPKRREALTLPENVNRVLISQKLVTLVRDVPLETPLDDLAAPALDGSELVAFLKAMELTTITRRVGELTGVDVAAIEPDPRFVGPAGWQGRNGEAALAVDAATAPASAASEAPPAAPEGMRPAELARTRAAEAKAPVDRSTYRTVRSLDELGVWIARAHEVGACRVRHRDDLARSAAGRTRRLLAGGRAERGLLRPARPSHGRGGPVRRRRARSRSDPRGGRDRAPKAAPGSAGRAQDRP